MADMTADDIEKMKSMNKSMAALLPSPWNDGAKPAGQANGKVVKEPEAWVPPRAARAGIWVLDIGKEIFAIHESTGNGHPKLVTQVPRVNNTYGDNIVESTLRHIVLDYNNRKA